VATATGVHSLSPGSALVLGTGQWCSMLPMPSARMWTLYLDEALLRTHMSLVLPDSTRVVPGAHPDSWDGSALLLHPGVDVLHRNEPLWRQISVVDPAAGSEVAAARSLALFARTVEFSLPTLLTDEKQRPRRTQGSVLVPVRGTLVRPPIGPLVRRSMDLLRSRKTEQWTLLRLAREVAVSKTHLTRMFSAQAGISPMRFLTEIRLTEFTRLLEETELPISVVARSVGWVDSRVAARWFRRRFGVAPSEFRRHPHPADAPHYALGRSG